MSFREYRHAGGFFVVKRRGLWYNTDKISRK